MFSTRPPLAVPARNYSRNLIATIGSNKTQGCVVHLRQLGVCMFWRRRYRSVSQVNCLRYSTRLQFTKDLIEGLPSSIVFLLIQSSPQFIAEFTHSCKGRKISFGMPLSTNP